MRSDIDSRFRQLLFAAVIGLIAVLAMSAAGWAAGIDTISADLPPEGVYVSPAEYHEYAAAGIVLDDPTHTPLLELGVIRTPVGNDEIEDFQSEFTAVEIGLGGGPVTLTGAVSVITTDRLLSTTGTFDTEIVSMSLSGTLGIQDIQIRQDPDRASTGVTDITDLGGGLYHIDSFFDVFTELSVDNGPWIDSDSYTRMYLVPEPGTILLVVLGLAVLAAGRRRTAAR
jgi:hypothetical protein